MKWEEIRKVYPEKFLLIKELDSHIEGNKKYVDDMAVIKVIEDENEASKLLVRCKGDTFVYHTAKENVVMQVVMNPVVRGVFRNEHTI